MSLHPGFCSTLCIVQDRKMQGAVILACTPRTAQGGARSTATAKSRPQDLQACARQETATADLRFDTLEPRTWIMDSWFQALGLTLRPRARDLGPVYLCTGIRTVYFMYSILVK